MNRDEGLSRMTGARSGHLGTIRPDGNPHVVVVTFAMIESHVVTAIDQKPKSTHRLQRLLNVEANPVASFLVDHYDEDWRRLWWVRVDGSASIHIGDSIRQTALEALAAKYPQYRADPPQGPVIAVSQDRVSSWAYSE